MVHGQSTGFQVIAPSLPRSKASIAAMSSPLSSKSNTCEFERMPSGRADFGKGMNLQCRDNVNEKPEETEGMTGSWKRKALTRAEETSGWLSELRPCHTEPQDHRQNISQKDARGET